MENATRHCVKFINRIITEQPHMGGNTCNTTH